MPTNAFNVGRDVSLDIIDPVQGPLRFGLRTGFDGKPQYKKLESHALDGIPRFAAIPAGHQITFMFDRADSRIDAYFASQEAAYFAGAVLPNVTITETITEVDGSVTRWKYTGVSLTLEDAGTWKGDAITTQSISAMASKKVQG